MYSDYPLLRESLAPEFAQLPVRELDQLVRTIYGPEATAEDVEGLFDDIGRGLKSAAKGVGRFAQQAAPVLARALPGVASGAATGAAFGPWGALIGAGAGLAGGLLSQSKDKTARSVGGAIGQAGQLVSAVRGGGGGGALGSLATVASGALGNTPAGRGVASAMRGSRSGGGGANSLMGLLSRPELTQALTAAALGGAGRPTIPIGGHDVPVHQMLAALGQLSQRAAHEAAENDPNAEVTPQFAEAAAETLGIDADDAEGRTDALLTLLALSPSIWMSRPQPSVNVSVAQPADPYFPAGEDFSAELWEDWSEDWGAESESIYEAEGYA